jgi:hypothetical protein
MDVINQLRLPCCLAYDPGAAWAKELQTISTLQVGRKPYGRSTGSSDGKVSLWI